ncbi:MAG: histidine phosphatase family protein [Candidatus Thiodiazotropha sp. (ex Dulcina madagascariensis)]|nr:histidine phosphatase family protein [Candidatus Thiodiazotropha sp. (ex Dulcina madagascariensis)]
MQITLLRHGKPVFELSGKVRAKELSNIAKLYDASGIVGEPPREVMAAVEGHNAVVCSNLARSMESARALGFHKIHLTEPLFRETAIPHFNSGSVMLPISAWVFILRSLWLLGFSRNGESFAGAKRRAVEAAQRLIQLANEYGSVLLVGHGLINHLIAKELLMEGWVGPSRSGRGFWDYVVYRNITT